MKLRIEAENFCSYPKIDWELPEGLTLIDGVNKDTGGSNMAGKSALLNSWFWCRYGWLPKWKGPKGGSVDSVLRRKNNTVVGPALVRVSEQFGPNLVCIERHRPNRLKVWVNGVEQKGMDQKGLEALLGMGAERFLVCVYLPQRRSRSFFWMGDNERMELLSVASGLEDVERALEKAKGMRDDGEKKIDLLKSQLSFYERASKELPGQIEALTNGLQDADKRYHEMKDESFRCEMRLDEYSFDSQLKAKEEVDREIDPLVELLADLKFEIQTLQVSYDSQQLQLAHLPTIEPEYLFRIKRVEKEIEAFKNADSILRGLKEQHSRLLLLAETMEAGTCSQCSQLLPEDVRVREAQKYRAEADLIENKIQMQAGTKFPDLDPLIQELNAADEAYHSRKAQIEIAPAQIQSQLSAVQATIKQKQAEERAIQKDILEIRTRVNAVWQAKEAELRNAVSQATSNLKHLGNAREVASASLDAALQNHSKIEKLTLSAAAEVSEEQMKFDQALDLIEIFGPKGYRAICFDGMIEKISERAGQLLGVMTDNLYSTRLDQVGQDSKGNQKLILKPVLIKGGSEVPLDDLSGGAEERIALAYDVALSEAAGEGLPLLLDEVLGGLDAVGKSEAMAVLEEVSKSRPVLVVDHSSEFKALFSQVVKILYEGEESRLEIA